MTPEYKYDVFISYSRKDYVDEHNVMIPGNEVSKIKEALTRAGITFWFDEEGIYIGDKFPEKIIEGIENSRLFLFISSKNACESPWTSKEIACADEYGKFILPVRIDKTPYNKRIMFRIADLNYIDYENDPEKGRQEVVRSIIVHLKEIKVKEEKSLADEKRRQEDLKLQRKLQEEEKKRQEKIEKIETEIDALEAQRTERKKTVLLKEQELKLAQAELEACEAKIKKFQDKLQELKEPKNEEDTNFMIRLSKAAKEFNVGVTTIREFLAKKGFQVDSSPNAKLTGEMYALLVKEYQGEKELKNESMYLAEEKYQVEKKQRLVETNPNVRIFTMGETSFKMSQVEGGKFMMGSSDDSPEAYPDERPLHLVELSSFYIGETVVTQGLWKAVMGNNPSYFKGDDLPVDRVAYNHDDKNISIIEFVNKLNDELHKNRLLPQRSEFRLPTEAEWEYAARGGKKGGGGFTYNGSDNIDEVAWWVENSKGKSHPVKRRQPNDLGLFDMSGNVWEWCQDWYISGCYKELAPAGLSGTNSASRRVLRGGDWRSNSRECRVACRNYCIPTRRGSGIGFRLVLSPTDHTNALSKS